jgi:RimJ/RimL family protein N-acetyltransferase
MGVDISKLPSRDSFIAMLEGQFHKPIEEKRAYCIIWLLNDQPVGHSNTNPTFYGKEGNMHLHIWHPENRKKGLGEVFLQMTIPLFFKNLELNKLVCEPYALNPAPHKALLKLGFELEKEYTTTPGAINFEQPVKRWVLTEQRFSSLHYDL